MQRYFRELNFQRCPNPLRIGMMIIVILVLFIIAWCFVDFVENIDAWSKYQRAKMEARTFQSATCRIEDIIVEETPPDDNKRVKMTSIKGFFLLRVVNSTNKQDQIKLAEVPLLHKPGQHSLMNSSLTCFYDPTGIEQAQLTISDLWEVKRTFKVWCIATVITSITSLLFISFFIMKFFKDIHQFIRSRHRVTTQIAMQPINFA